MDLAFYPFDYQTCPIHLVMVHRTASSPDRDGTRNKTWTVSEPKKASFGFPAGQLKLSWNNKGKLGQFKLGLHGQGLGLGLHGLGFHGPGLGGRGVSGLRAWTISKSHMIN